VAAEVSVVGRRRDERVRLVVKAPDCDACHGRFLTLASSRGWGPDLLEPHTRGSMVRAELLTNRAQRRAGLGALRRGVSAARTKGAPGHEIGR
jgi:hypothetical protein